MRTAVLLSVVVTALAFAGSASAGCFATAGLTPPPATVGPGDTWNATITVKQHGMRPIPDATPTLTIVGEDGARKQFAAKPTDTVGVYTAAVVFPTAGTWGYEVNDGFVGQEANGQTWDCSTTHTFAAVTIGGSSSGPAPGDPSSGVAPAEPALAPADDGTPSLLIVLLVAAAVSLATAAGVVLARRSGRRHARA
jgi:hypothetical protein